MSFWTSGSPTQPITNMAQVDNYLKELAEQKTQTLQGMRSLVPKII
ncbi:hypothetical protein [Aerosakkonema funiforme]